MGGKRQGPGDAGGVNRGLRTSVGALVALVACCGAIFWAFRVAWDSVPVNGWAKSLRSGSGADRRAAAEKLGSLVLGEAGVAIPALIAALEDDDNQVSATAARSLGSAWLTASQTPAEAPLARAAAEALTRALADRRAEVRAEAVLALGLIAQAWAGGTAPPCDFPAVAVALSEAIAEPSDRVRTEAVQALASIGSKAPVPPPPALVAALGRDRSADLRAAAATALGGFRTGIKSALPALIGALRDDDAKVRCRAAIALGWIGPAAAPAIPALIATLKGPAPPRPVTPRPAGGLQLIGLGRGEATPDAWDPGEAAARALGSIAAGAGQAERDQAIAALAEALQSDYAWRRGAAAEGLMTIGAPASAATPALIAFLKEGAQKDLGNDSWAARALGVVAPGSGSAEEAVAALIAALDAKSDGTRGWSADSLGRFGPAAAAAVPRLRILEKGSDRTISSKAAAARKRIESAPKGIEASTR
jgi:HEAT repeat protein